MNMDLTDVSLCFSMQLPLRSRVMHEVGRTVIQDPPRFGAVAGRIWRTRRRAAARMSAEREATRMPTKRVGSESESFIRPRGVRRFSVPFGEAFIIRDWRPRDRAACMEIISAALREHGLSWDADGADRDVIEVERAYSEGEFWVVEDISSARVVGTAAFYPAHGRGEHVVEIRKMYLSPCARRQGLGAFLLAALESRAAQLGFHVAIVETASVLKRACHLYRRAGYSPATDVHTARCDMVMQKLICTSSGTFLSPVLLPTHSAPVEVIESTRGWTVAAASRDVVTAYRLAFRAVAVLVETGEHVLVHRRSMRKATYPGRWAALVTGCAEPGETPLETAKREVVEEVGVDHLEFYQPFQPFLDVGDDPEKHRILFHPFVASGHFQQCDVICNPDEVDCSKLLTRAEIQQQQIGGSLWAKFRAHGL